MFALGWTPHQDQQPIDKERDKWTQKRMQPIPSQSTTEKSFHNKKYKLNSTLQHKLQPM